MNNSILIQFLSVFWIISFIAYFFKTYMHYKYLKIVFNYSQKITFFTFLKIKYFHKSFVIVLPFFFKNKSEIKSVSIKKVKKNIYILLLIFWIGLISMLLSINFGLV